MIFKLFATTEMPLINQIASILVNYRELELNVNYAPISVFYFQIYEAQKMQKQWNSMLGVQEASDEENDIVKVCFLQLTVMFYLSSHRCFLQRELPN